SSREKAMARMGIESSKEIQPIEEIDEFIVVERIFSSDPELLSVGLANIHSVVPDIEGNKARMLRALKIFKDRKVNAVVFPEFCLTGYFWEDQDACRAYMDTGLIENQYDWIERSIKPMLDDTLREVVLNG